MSRPSKGPYLYLDDVRDQWVLRDGREFMRLALRGNDREAAEAILARYKADAAFVEEPPSAPGVGVIYFITAQSPDYPIKIGYTARLSNLRIKSLQVACPYRMYFMGHITGTIPHERAIHHKFDHLRLEGEWFRNTPELQAYIKDAIAAGDFWGSPGMRAAQALEAKP